MGYYEGLINGWFKKSGDNNLIFYPYGKFGSGYIVSGDDEIKIRRFLGAYLKISLVLSLVCVFFFGVFALLLLIFFIPFYSINIGKLLTTAERTQENLTLRELTENMATSMGVPTSICLLIASILLVGASIAIIYLRENILVGIVGILFFGLALLQSIFLVKYSIEAKKKK